MSSRRSSDLLCSDLLAVCPGCQEFAPNGATVCAECGTHLFVQVAGRRAFTKEGPHGCTCGGNDICTACVLASYEEPAR